MLAFLRPLLAFVSLLGLLPADVNAAEYLGNPPARVLASVRVDNGGTTCSATMISRGPRWACGVSAAHCFRGNVGGKFTIHFADGSQTEATLLAIDRSIDVARFAVAAAHVLAVAPLPSSLAGPAIYEACGFPAGNGPCYYRLSPAQDSVSHAPGFVRWKFNVDDGGAIPGCSGCGIFANAQLCGVLSHNDGESGKVCYGCPLPKLIAFLQATDRAGCDAWRMGTWWARPVAASHAPPPLAIRSGDRIEVIPALAPDLGRPNPQSNCPGGVCPRQMASVPAPPPDADAGRTVPRSNQTPQSDRQATEPPYDGHGRPPEGLRTPRQRSSEIDKLRKKLAELDHEPLVPPFENDPPSVEPGPAPELPAQHKSPALACVLGAFSFVGVYFLKFHKAAQAA